MPLSLTTALEARLRRLPRQTYRDRPQPRERFPIRRGPWQGQTLYAPHPRDIAALWLAPALDAADLRVAKDGATLYVLPLGASREHAEPLDVEALAEDLRRLVLALPADGLPEHLADLRGVVEHADPEKVRRYFVAVAVRARIGARPLPAPRRESAPRPAPMSASARSAAREDRLRERKRDTARAWLDVVADDLLAEHGGAIASSALWQAAEASPLLAEWLDDYADALDSAQRGDRRALDDWTLDAQDEGLPEAPAMPGRNTLQAVAAEVLHRRRRRGVTVFVARA